MEALGVALHARGVPTSAVVLGDDAVSGDLVVVDSYRIRADGVGVRARRRAAVDDIDRDLVVDLVVDPAPDGAREAEGPERAGRVLRGLRYALLDPTLANRNRVDVEDEVETVLVATGAADVVGVGASVASALRSVLPTARVRLVVGPWSSTDSPEGVEAVHARAGLAEPLLAADLVVCAAGVTMLEALALGCPTVGFLTAANQRRYLAALAALGAVVASTQRALPGVVSRLVGDPVERRRLGTTGRELVDGLGAARVADAVAALAAP